MNVMCAITLPLSLQRYRYLELDSMLNITIPLNLKNVFTKMCFYSIAKYVWVIVKEIKLNDVSIYTVDKCIEHLNNIANEKV